MMKIAEGSVMIEYELTMKSKCMGSKMNAAE